MKYPPIIRTIVGEVLSGGRPKPQSRGCPAWLNNEYQRRRPLYMFDNGILRPELATVRWRPESKEYVGIYYQHIFNRHGQSIGVETYVWAYRGGRMVELDQSGPTGARRRCVGF